MARRLKRKRSDDPSRPAPETAAPFRTTVAPAAPPTNIVVTLIKAAILIALGIYIYYPSLFGLYLWDDDFLIQNNPIVHDPRGIWYIWTDPEHALIDFFPLTVSVEWLIWQTFWDPISMANDPQFWQMTFYFHITSLILHLVNGLMIWFLFRKMGIRLAWLGALLFVVHPAIVESVSWMAELKNTIAMPTFILAVLAWIGFERTRRWEFYLATFVLYLISMLTKTSCVMFPVIILLYDWWKHPETNFVELFFAEIVTAARASWALLNFDFRRFGNEVSQLRWTFAPTIPFFIVAVADAYFLIIYLRHGVGEQFIPGLLGGPIGRTACAGLSLIFYFSKCVLPVNLLPIYTQWEVNQPAFTLEYILKFLPWPVMAFGFWWLWRRSEQSWARTAFFGFGFFFLNLLPFVGWRAISFMRFGWVMDHFLYVPILGLIGLAAAGAGDIYDRIPRAAMGWRVAAISVAVAVVAIFTVGSHEYAGDFVDRLTYWTYCADNNWVAWPAHNNRGNQLLDNASVADRKGYHEEAAELLAESKKEFQIALMLNPVYTEAHNNLGYILSREGQSASFQQDQRAAVLLQQAETEFRTALSYTPDFESAQLNLKNVQQLEVIQSYLDSGAQLAQQGRYKEAEAQFRQVLQYQPGNPVAQRNLSQVLELEATPAPAPISPPVKPTKATSPKSR